MKITFGRIVGLYAALVATRIAIALAFGALLAGGIIGLNTWLR